MANKSKKNVTGWVGWIFFAGLMMVLQGLFNAVAGLTALFNSGWLVVTADQLLVYDLTAWGWFHIVVGFVVLMAGISIMQGAVWARAVGVAVAIVSAVGTMATVDAYPWWSMTILVVDILIIYALVVHGDELVEN